MKGSVASVFADEIQSPEQAVRRIWDKQYALRPTSWKGPYNLTPITQRFAPGACVLDIGCGVGRYLVPLVRNGFGVVGADLSRQALTLLDSHYARVVADIQQLPFPDRSFDAITCYGVLQHLDRAGREKAVAELFRILKHRGVTFVEVIGHLDMRNNCGRRIAADTFIRDEIPIYHFSLSKLSEIFHLAGFSILSADEKLIQKQYKREIRKRHRIFIIIRKP
ncbi:MAG: class I SAM-dependent methyltransferase [Halobacteriota archaeon]